MTRRRKIIGLTAIVGLACVLWVGDRLIYTLRHLPEAYAAWDAGELLVAYLETHENHWPTSWDDLLSVLDTPRGSDITLRAPHANESDYAHVLQGMIAIDWSFDPAHAENASPVTRRDGSAFSVLWQDGDPNEMVREHLKLNAGDDH